MSGITFGDHPLDLGKSITIQMTIECIHRNPVIEPSMPKYRSVDTGTIQVG
jgi:hypothetical protein